MSLIENSVEELVPLEEKQTFEAENHLWLVTSQAHQGKRAPGLCSKSYCIKGTDNEMVKVSMKGVNKNQFDNPMAHYQESLESITIFRATNLSIRRRELDMTTYCPMMDALTYFYPKQEDVPQSHSISTGSSAYLSRNFDQRTVLEEQF